MKINIEFRSPTPSHVEIAIFLDGGYTGTITTTIGEAACLHQILFHGCAKGIDSFSSKGSIQYNNERKNNET